MDEKLFNAIIQEDMEEVIGNLIEPQQHFGVTISKTDYNFDFEQSALDSENLLVRVHIWIKNMFEIDEFSTNVNRLLKAEYKYTEETLWDYDVPELLSEYGIEVDYISGDYTYNDSDYCRLNRDVHYTLFQNDEGSDYIVFSIHHGADARVGFGQTICLKIIDFDYFFNSQRITGYDSETEVDIEWHELEDIATYNKESDEWIHNESGNVITLYTSADGF